MDRYPLQILYHRTKKPARAGAGGTYLRPEEDCPSSTAQARSPFPRGGRQETGFRLARVNYKNKSKHLEMSLLSRLRGSKGYGACGDEAIAPYFSFYWKYGATLRSSVPSLKPLFLRFWVMRWVFAGLIRFPNRSFDLLRRDGPCRLPDGFVHWTHLLAWISMTFYLIKAAERRTRFALDLRSFSNFICSTER